MFFRCLTAGFLLFGSAGLFACARAPEPTQPPVIPERPNSENDPGTRAPITQIRQTLNLMPGEAFEAVMSSFQRKRISMSSVTTDTGVIETDWVPVRDSVCGGYRMHGAPLDCRVRFSAKIEALSLRASALHLRYQEVCSLNEEIPLECPGSNAEKMMLSVLEDVKAVDDAR